MRKKNHLIWMAFLFFLGGGVFLFRFAIINWLQQKILYTAGKFAIVNNNSFANADSFHRQHLIYSLAGIDRIWPHRVNSFKRFNNLYNQFKGFECDIRFDSDNRKLYVAHDAKEVSLLTFTDYLKADPGHKLFWLDIKNLDLSNINIFCETLIQIDKQFAV